MIKPTPVTCNKEVQKFTNTSYDILLKLYNNTAFFEELYAQINPSYYADFAIDSFGWLATDGTGYLLKQDNYLESSGGDFYKSGLSIDAAITPNINIIFKTEVVTSFVGNIIVTYDDTTVVAYEGVITNSVDTSAVSVDLSQYDTHVGTITAINFVLGSIPTDNFSIYKVVAGKDLVSTNSLSKLNAELINLAAIVSNNTLNIANIESRTTELEEKPVINLNEDTLDELSERFQIDTLSFNGLSKKIIIKDDGLHLVNADGSSYLIYSLADEAFNYKGVLELMDGTVITSIDDIRAENGSYVEIRYARGVTPPILEEDDFDPTNWTVTPPVSDLPLWMTTATKKNNELVSFWTTPVLLSSGPVTAVIASLTATTYLAISESDGTNPNLTGAGGEFSITDNGVKVTSGVTFSGGVTKSGLTLVINPSTGLFNLSGSNWNSDAEFFDLVATYKGQNYVRRFSIAKQKSSGAGGSTVLTLMLYKATTREATSLSGLTGPVTFNLNDLTLTENSTNALNGWSLVLPENTLPKRWAIQVTISTADSLVQIQPAQWSTPKVFSIDGVDGIDVGSGTGIDGFSRATVYVYKAAETVAPEDNPGDCVYTFSTGAIILANGWQTTIPDTALPVWARTGLAISQSTVDTINAAEWSEAVKITGASLNSAQLFIYKRSDAGIDSADKPSVSASYDFITGILSGVDNGWSVVPPEAAGKNLWIRAAMASSTGLTDDIAPTEWSEARLLSSNGSDGTSAGGEAFPGAERKGASYPNFSWSALGIDSATSRWGTLAGRSPVAGDVFIQVSTVTGLSEVRSYNGTAWVIPEEVYESLVVLGVLSGDQILAGSIINAPIIRGGALELSGNVASTFMSIYKNDPFGPNNLVEWYGPKIEGVTWNSATNAPIYSGMTKSNAKTYKDSSGGVFFGGTFSAGTLSNAQTVTIQSATAVNELIFNSNGAPLSITSSFSYYNNFLGDASSEDPGSVTCPLTPSIAAPTGTLYLEEWNGTNWVVKQSQVITGSYYCENGFFESEPGTPNTPYNETVTASAVFTALISPNLAGTRRFRTRVLLGGAVYNSNVLQTVSMATVE